MIFIELSELKTRLGVSNISVLRNPATSKIFASAGGQTFKVQQGLDLNAPIRFMYETEETFNEGCITNVKPVETVFSL